MNKKLRYGLLTLLAFMGLTLSAQTTFDFDNDYATLFPSLTGTSANGVSDGDFTVSTTSTAVNGFTVTVSAADEGVTNANRIWNASPRLRMYSGTLTITGSGIKSIEFDWGKGNITTSTGELKGTVWTGSANEVVFNVLGNTQIKSIIINGDATPPDVTEEDLNHGTEEDPISVAEAIYAAEVVGSADSKEDFYVYGTISSIVPDKNTGTPYTYSYKGNATYYITDGKGNEFQIYQGKYFSGVTWEEGMADIAEGDKVVVCGKIVNFKGSTPEFVNGKSHLVLLNGKGYEEPVVVPTITNVTVEEFLAEAEGSDSWYRLSGMVTNLKEGNQYGNFDLKDNTGIVYVYGVLSEEGGESGQFQELAEQYGIKNGGYITIVGKRGKQNGNPAVKNAYFEDYEAGSDPETFEVNVADALDAAAELFENEKSFDFYQVTGYVVEEPSYERKSDDDSLYGNVNLKIADTKGGTNTLTIYHGKSLNNEAFTEETLDLYYKGDLVTFFGKLQNYVKTDKETGETTQTYELVEGYLVKASASLEMPESGLASFCSAYPIEVGEDQNVYIVTEVGTNKALVQKVEPGIIESGTGLLVEGSGTVNFPYAYGEKGTAQSGNMLVGTMAETKVAEGEAYVLKDGAFHLCSAGSIPARKAYLPVNSASGAKIVSIVFDGSTTGINEMKAQDSSREIYTIGGIRVKNAQQKGVYIINGKKVVK